MMCWIASSYENNAPINMEHCMWFSREHHSKNEFDDTSITFWMLHGFTSWEFPSTEIRDQQFEKIKAKMNDVEIKE